MWVGEDSAFADSGSQGYVKVHIGQRKLMARVRMTSEAIHDSMKSEGAFKSARKDEMNRLIDDIARMEEYSCTADGRGVLSLIDDASPNGATTLTVDAPGGIVGDDFGNRFFLPNMYVVAVNPATGEMRTQARKVISASADGTSIVLDAVCDASWADNDYLVQAANSSVTSILDTSYENAAWGLTALFDDGTYRTNYFNVDRNLYPQYQAYVKASTGTLSEDLFQQIADVVDQRLGGDINLMTAHHSVRRLVIQLTQADRRYSGSNLMKPDAGTTSSPWGTSPSAACPSRRSALTRSRCSSASTRRTPGSSATAPKRASGWTRMALCSSASGRARPAATRSRRGIGSAIRTTRGIPGRTSGSTPSPVSR